VATAEIRLHWGKIINLRTLSLLRSLAKYRCIPSIRIPTWRRGNVPGAPVKIFQRLALPLRSTSTSPQRYPSDLGDILHRIKCWGSREHTIFTILCIYNGGKAAVNRSNIKHTVLYVPFIKYCAIWHISKQALNHTMQTMHLSLEALQSLAIHEVPKIQYK
jgi:hypothetical protein